jgi:exonuclease SbcC
VIPIKLRISGFLSYNQPVEVDFQPFELACITGANGAGKSSLLDALTWVLFGEARRKDDSIINHQSKAAEVRFDFIYESNTYRLQRSKAKDKSAVLEFFILDEEKRWKPLTEPTLRGTEELIRHTLHLDYETFVNTSFFLQGKADMFAEQKPGDRKRILASILGLDVWEAYKEEAARRRRNSELDLANVEGFINEIESELNQEEERKKQLAAAETEYNHTRALLEAKKQVLDQQRLIQDRIRNEERQLEKQASELSARRADVNTLKIRLAKREDERNAH